MPRTYKRSKKSSTRTRKRSYKSKYSSRKSSRTFKKKVQSIINQNLEDKVAYKSVMNVNYNSIIDGASDLNFLIPNMAKGTANNARIGDQVRAKSLTITGWIISNLTTTDYSSSRIGVRMMVVQPKGYISQFNISSNATTWLPRLLKKGGTISGFQGTTADFIAPINTDYITCYYDRKMYIEAPYIPGTNEGINNVRHMTKFFKIKIKIRNKILKYDDGDNGGLTPTHFNPVLLLGYCHLDSSGADNIQTQINLSYDSKMYFQDA